MVSWTSENPDVAIVSYGTVILVDLRYYKGAVSELCAQEQFDDILICYSIGNFMTDANIIWLR